MIREDFHRRLRVWIVSGLRVDHLLFIIFSARYLEFEFFDSELFEESVKNTNQVGERDIVISDEAFDLMELCEMGVVQGFISEHSIDTKHSLKALKDIFFAQT